MPCPGLLHPEPLQESTADPDLRRRRSHTALSQSLWGLWVLVPLFERSEHLWREWGLILNTNSPLLPSCWGFSFVLGHRVSPHSRSCHAATDPRLRQRLLDTPGQVWLSPLRGRCSFLPGPGAHMILPVPSKSLFPTPVQVLAALWWVNGDLLQEGLCHTQVF